MKNEKLKEEVGNNLLTAMKNIDSAVHCIVNNLEGYYEQEVDTLIKTKRELKKILNKHFDELAIKRAVEEKI